MKSKLLQSGVMVRVGDIEMGNRLRPVSEAGIASLEASYRELGVLKDPIHVRKKKGGQLVLMAGAHRLSFAQRAFLGEIKADIWECDNTFARLMEIDDNLAGAELTPLDTAIFLAERKAVYEELHPETKAGVAGASARWGDATDIVSFAASAAEKMGCSPKHVRRMAAAGAVLTGEQRRWLRAAPRPVLQADLLTLAKISDDHERSQVCMELSNGAAKSAAQARASFAAKTGAGPAPKDPVEEALKALSTAWARAPKAARMRFLRDQGVTIFNLLREIRGEKAE